jgi:hypothetical protein
MPRGAGWLSGPERALRNRVYRRTTIDPLSKAGIWLLIVLAIGAAMVVAHLFGE